jgi:hypothetical protein
MHFVASERRQPRGVIARALALSGAALLGATLLVWAPPSATGFDAPAAEATLWQLLNGARINNGVSPLIQHSTLVSLARWRSKDMIDRDYFNHTILGTNYQVYHWYDTNGLSYVWGGENIGWNNGYSDADSPVKIHEGFMNSAGHRKNMLEPSWTHGGVGAYGADNITWGGKLRSPRMYTELFMQAKSSATPAPTPTPPPSTPRPTATQPPATPKPTPKPTTAPTAAPSTPRPTPFATPSQVPTESPSPTASPTQDAATASPSESASAEPSTSPSSSPSAEPQVSSLRVQPAASENRGIFETVIGSILGFLFG